MTLVSSKKTENYMVLRQCGEARQWLTSQKC
jgi:hypothetical protein